MAVGDVAHRAVERTTSLSAFHNRFPCIWRNELPTSPFRALCDLCGRYVLPGYPPIATVAAARPEPGIFGRRPPRLGNPLAACGRSWKSLPRRLSEYLGYGSRYHEKLGHLAASLPRNRYLALSIGGGDRAFSCARRCAQPPQASGYEMLGMRCGPQPGCGLVVGDVGPPDFRGPALGVAS